MGMNLGFERRVSALEKQYGIGQQELPIFAQIILQPGDSEAAAMAKYCAEHPELDGKELSWIVRQTVTSKDGRRCPI